jgi:hypothetical protein
MVMEYLPRGSIFDVINNAEEKISWKVRRDEVEEQTLDVCEGFERREERKEG